MADAPTPPRGLQAAGKALWREMWGELPESLEFDSRETTILTSACRQADVLAALDRAIKSDGAMIAGSTGQRRLHPAITEARQGRLTLARLLGELELPLSDERPMTAAQRRARDAATSRWEQRRALREAAGG